MEYPLHFFMDMAWNPESWTPPRLADYPRRWAAAQFGPEHASAIGDLVEQYSRFNSRRKPELLSGTTYSVENFREADNVVDEYNALLTKAEEIDATLPEAARSAFFQLVLFPIRACANLNDMYVSVAKNDLYNSQGRASTNAMADRVQTLFNNDATIADQFHAINGGKWDQLMTQTHISYTTWDNPEVDVVPTTKRLQASGAAAMGVSVEGSRAAATTGTATLPELTAYYPDEDRRIEVFNRGAGSFDFTATSDKPYVTVTPASGSVTADTRLTVKVDWAQVPMGDSTAAIALTGGTATVTVNLPLRNPESPRPEAVEGFVESNGYVSMEASHFTERVDGADTGWIQVPRLGRTLSGMVSDPPSAASVTPSGNSPHLDYKMHLFTTGQVTVDVYLSPSLPVHGSGLRYAVGFDGGQSTSVNIHTDLPATFTDTAPVWEKWVSDNVILKSTTHNITAAGEHTLNLWMVDPGVVVQKIVVKTAAVPATYLGPPARLPLNVETEVIAPEIPPGDAPGDPTTSDDTGPGNTGGGTTDPTATPTSGSTSPGSTTGGTSPTPTDGTSPVTPGGTDPSPTSGQPGSTTTTPGGATSAPTTGGVGTDGSSVGTQESEQGCACSVPGRKSSSDLGLIAFAAVAVAGLTRVRRRGLD
jgi:MYXO-CTERM domain-containing protein